jgi:glycosyltransferase involved in cell wall biosynthesis
MQTPPERMPSKDLVNAWVVMPAYNEQKVIGQTIRQVRLLFPNVVVVDDCSRDDTRDQALAAGATVCRHPINLGQGAALQTGVEYALAHGATEIITLDSDGQHSAEDALAMLALLRQKQVQAVLGSRFIGKAEGISAAKRLFLKAAIGYTQLTTGLKLTDTHNGLRVLARSAAQAITIRHNRMAHASEILEQIAEKKISYIEAPCTIVYTDYSKAKGQRMSGAFAILADLFLGRMYRL